MIFLDCTLRDGGYYNAWDFSRELICDYLKAMKAVQVDVVEMGFRFLNNSGFKGACAFTTDDFLYDLQIPEGLSVGVMCNGSDFCTDIGVEGALRRLFPVNSSETPVDIVRIASHYHELPQAFEAAGWLNQRGYRVGVNLMQISDRSEDEIIGMASMAAQSPVEVLYLADSMGSMSPDDISRVVRLLRHKWKRNIGFHAHDNIGLALSNTLRAYSEGVEWLDSTVSGMGRGPGNVRTEELAVEIASIRHQSPSFVPLMTLLRKYFSPMKERYGWGTNLYYYLAGKYSIHPTFIQEMLGDAHFDEEEIIAVINHLRIEGGKKFSLDMLETARHFFDGELCGSWVPAEQIAGREVLIIGSGPGVKAHQRALEAYIRRSKPVVLVLNTQDAIDPELINFRVACHPVRLLADAERHASLPQPIITPVSMLPNNLRVELGNKKMLDFGLRIKPGCFEFYDTYCIAPTSLVLAYALAVARSGKAERILMAGFDGYPNGDRRNNEVESLLLEFMAASPKVQLVSITPTCYKNLYRCSLYGI